MVPSAPSPASPSRPRVVVLLLAFGVFGGGTAWVLHLTLSYAVVPLVCAWEDATLLHLLTGGMGLVALGAVVASIQAFRLAGGEEGGEVDRFLAATGMILSGFFLALILVEGLPVLMTEDPCRAVPTQDRPIVRALEGPSAGTPVRDGGLPIHGTRWAGGGTRQPEARCSGSHGAPPAIRLHLHRDLHPPTPGGPHGRATPT